MHEYLIFIFKVILTFFQLDLDEHGRKQNSQECTVSQNIKSKSCQTRTGSAGIGGNSGSNGEDEDEDENKNPRKLKSCNDEFLPIVKEEEEQEPKPTLPATIATDINDVGEQQENNDEESQTLTAEVSKFIKSVALKKEEDDW